MWYCSLAEKRKRNNITSAKRSELFRLSTPPPQPLHTHTLEEVYNKLAAVNLSIFTHERRHETIRVHVSLFYWSDVSARVQLSRPGSALKQCGAVYMVIREPVNVSLARSWLHILYWHDVRDETGQELVVTCIQQQLLRFDVTKSGNIKSCKIIIVVVL